MNTKSKSGSFPEFNHHISDIQRYIRAGETFTLMFKNGKIVHHISKEQEAFEKWLKDHDIMDIKK
jgi:hypothetical protein